MPQIGGQPLATMDEYQEGPDRPTATKGQSMHSTTGVEERIWRGQLIDGRAREERTRETTRAAETPNQAAPASHAS